VILRTLLIICECLLANYASAFLIELRRGNEGDSRDYLRFKFANGTANGGFKTVHAFGHNGDIPLTEFIYRTEPYKISSNREWADICKGNSVKFSATELDTTQAAAGGFAVALVFFSGIFAIVRYRKRAGQIRLGEDAKELRY
jgi:hypothetical protein